MPDDMKRAAGTGSEARWRERDHRWETRVTVRTVNGRQERRSFFSSVPGDLGKAEAEAKRDAFTRDLSVGLVLAGPRLTVAAYLRDWLETIRKANKVRPTTWARYRGICENNIIPAIGHVPLVKLNATMVERMTADATGHLSPRTAHHMRAVLRTALKRAEKHGLVRNNVADLADAVTVPDSERPMATADEVRRILQLVAGDRLAALFWTAIALGLRQAEILGLRRQDVDLDAAVLRVTGQVQRIDGELRRVDYAKTAKGRRLVGLPAPLVAVLRRHVAEQEMERRVARDAWHERGLLFTRPDGQPLYGTLIHREWVPIRNGIGRPELHFHDLRHASNSLMAALGVSTRARMEIMGHANSRTTDDVYTHVLPDELRAAADAMGRLLEGTR